jgi:threonine/homoserine/homoserine lactone efflux protein
MDVGYWDFAGIALAHGLAVASPGPDFALVLRQSLVHGRPAAVASAVGIGCGILIHVGYSLWGVGVLVSSSATAMGILKYAGAGYFAWLGWRVLRASVSPTTTSLNESTEVMTSRGAWLQGFLTNLLNVKASLFFIALFSAVAGTTTLGVQLFYGVWLVGATIIWFVLVALLFTKPRVRTLFLRYRVGLDRVMGLVFWGFALSLAFADLN